MIFTAQQIQKKHTEQNKNQHVSFIILAETFDTIAHRTLARSLGQSSVFDVEVEAKQSCIPFSYFPALPQMLLPDYTPTILRYKECGTSNHYLRDSRVYMNLQGHIRITTCSPFGVWLCLAAVQSAETEGIRTLSLMIKTKIQHKWHAHHIRRSLLIARQSSNM